LQGDGKKEEAMSKEAVALIRNTLGHGAFKVKSAERGWNYRAQQESEYLILDICGDQANAVVLLDTMETKVVFTTNEQADRSCAIQTLIRQGIAEARNANQRIQDCHLTAPKAQPPTYIRRVFIFETADGLEWGTTREEFGPIEPFLSVVV
jgi:hypothetical protein